MYQDVAEAPARAAAQARYLDLPDGRIEYRWFSPPRDGQPVIVMLHEGLGCIDMWRQFPDMLAARTGLPVVAYSRYGYGRSSPAVLPRPLDYLDYEGKTVLPRVLDALGVERPILFGHSDGATISLIYAATAPRGLESIILLAPHVFIEDVTYEGVALVRETYAPYLRDKLLRYHGDQTDGVFWGWNDIWLSADFRDWTIEGRLPRIMVPTLVVQGIQDQYATVRQVEVITRAVSARSAGVMLPDCYHVPHRDQPEALLASVTDFLGQW